MKAPQSLREAAELATSKAIELAARGDAGLWTITGGAVVVIGIATREYAYAIAVDRSEYDGLKLMEMIDGGLLHQGPERVAAACR